MPGARASSRFQLTAARCLIAAGVTAVAACGSVSAPSAGGGGASPGPARVSLHITVQNGVGTAPKFWTLRCDPAGGTHPDPAAACAALTAMKNPFAPPPAHQMCPMILASARRATFTGTWFGTKINRTVADGGCTLALWSKLGQVVN